MTPAHLTRRAPEHIAEPPVHRNKREIVKVQLHKTIFSMFKNRHILRFLLPEVLRQHSDNSGDTEKDGSAKDRGFDFDEDRVRKIKNNCDIDNADDTGIEHALSVVMVCQKDDGDVIEMHKYSIDTD
jgi:hypothetical protein